MPNRNHPTPEPLTVMEEVRARADGTWADLKLQAENGPIIKGAHGGRRPGAGAKPRNLNALKHGKRSDRLYPIIVATALYPEIRRKIDAHLRAQILDWDDRDKRRKQYRRMFDTMSEAMRLTLLDPRLGATIQDLILHRALYHYERLSRAQPAKNAPIRSNNQKHARTPAPTPVVDCR